MTLESEINMAYSRLEQKQGEIARLLVPYVSEFGWYNGHYHKDENGNWIRECYPIPVIGVTGLCDIEIQFDKISLSSKLKRDAALAYSFDKFTEYDFEAYGVEDYLGDFYHHGQTLQELRENILACDEVEIGLSFYFLFDTDVNRIIECLNLLGDEGFYY